MSQVQEFNLPNKDDPDFADKLVSSIQRLFESSESSIKALTPLNSDPDNSSVGDIWFDRASGKVKVMTDEGIKTLKFE
jgi:hypothetical protein